MTARVHLERIANALHLREPKVATAAALKLHHAWANYLKETGEEEAEIAEAMSDAALVTAYALIGLASGFNHENPNAPAVRATIDTLIDIAEGAMENFQKFAHGEKAGGLH